MQAQSGKLSAYIRDVPKPGVIFSLGSLVAVWTVLLFYDILFRGISVPVTADQSLFRTLFPLIGMIPFFLRWLKPQDIQSDEEAYGAFRRLSLVLLATAGVVMVLGIIPFSYGSDGAPTGIGSFILGRLVSLVLLAAVPWLAEQLVLIYRYRSRREVPSTAIYFTYGTIIVTILGQILPVSNSEDGVGVGMPMIVFGGILSSLALTLTFRIGWLINLKKREKVSLLGLSFVGMLASTAMITLGQDSDTGRALLSITPGISALMIVMSLSMVTTQITLFFNALIVLPTAEAIDRRNVEVSSLTNLARLLTQSFDSEELMSTAISIASDVTNGTVAWIESGEGESREVRYDQRSRVPHKVTNGLMRAQVGRDVTLSDSVRSNRKIQVIDRVSGARWANGGGEPKELRSVAAAPLQVGEELFGTIYVAKAKTYGFDRQDMAILGAVADQIALAIEHSRLVQGSLERERFEQEMLIARDLQRRLLPKVMPASPYYEIWAESEPASMVGGDYYDVVSFSDKTIGLLVADVSGKGASAALYMGMAKGIIQALSGTCATPHELMSQANLALHGNIDQRWFITMTCAQIIAEERKLRVARAGHCPTLLVRSGVASYSKPRGLGLAIARPSIFDKNLELEEMQFAPGDYVIFLSDGIPEARSPQGEELDYERLLAIVEDACGKQPSAEELRNVIFQEITSFIEGEPLGDDSTLVILRWL